MDKQYQPTLTEVQDWVLKLYNTCLLYTSRCV